MQIRTLTAALVLGTAAAAITVTTAPVTTATAQEMACGAREEMVERLQRSFGEAQTGLGLISEARILEVWSSEETGTWTILMTEAGGQSCMVAAGEAWKTVPIQAVVMGEPA